MEGAASSIIRTILVPTAFSDLSRHAARYAHAIAPAHRARIILFHAVEPAPPPAEAVATVPTALHNINAGDLVQIARENLQRFARENFPEGGVETRLGVGPPDQQIVETARDEHADLIIMGTHAKGILRRLVFGSISKSVLESAPCPVLLVPLAETPAPTA